MEQFDLQEYLKNPARPIVTRDGCAARVLCTDRISDICPVVALVREEISKDIFHENTYNYSKNGSRFDYTPSPKDLFFAPEKKEGWIRVYHGKGRYNTFVCNRIFATKEEAEKQKKDDVVAIIKIEWEE